MTIASLTKTPHLIADLGLPLAAPSDASVGIRELQELRHFDGIVPADAAGPAEGLVRTYRGEASASDTLRLPLPRNSDAFAVRGALERVSNAALQTTDPRERQMRDALSKFDDAVNTIQRRARNDP